MNCVKDDMCVKEVSKEDDTAERDKKIYRIDCNG